VGAGSTSKAISDKFAEKKDIFRNVTTFGGLPASCAAGLANIDIIEREKLVERAAAMGDYVAEKMKPLAVHPLVGDIRGLGLMWGIELVKDKQTKEKLTYPETNLVAATLRREGLITRVDDGIIRFMPPLIITEAEIDESFAIIDKVIHQMQDELLKK